MRTYLLLIPLFIILIIPRHTLQAAEEEANTAPTSADLTILIDEDSTYTFSVSDFAFTDPDEESALASITLRSLPSSGQLYINETVTQLNTKYFISQIGQLTYTPTANAFGEHYDSFTFTVSDGIDSSVSENTISFNVNNINDSPTISGIPEDSILQNETYRFAPESEDIDTSKDALTYTIDNKPSWAAFNPDSGVLTGTPDNSHIGSYENIIITVIDDEEASASLPPFTISVENINDAPTFTNRPATTVSEDSAYNYQPVVNDIDDIYNESVSLTYSITNPPVWANEFNSDDGILTGTPDNSQVGTYNNIIITVTDKEGASTSLPPFSITVKNTNDMPNGSVTIIGTAKEGELLTVTNELQDDDGLGVIRYRWHRSNDSGNPVSIGANSARYRLTNDDVGHTITATASYIDNYGTDEAVTSPPTAVVENAEHIDNALTGTVTISGNPFVGSLLTANHTLHDQDGPIKISYQWIRSRIDPVTLNRESTTIPDQAGSRYTPTSQDLNHSVSVIISTRDARGGTGEIRSAETAEILEADIDRDGMSNEYELAHGLDPYNFGDQKTDLDGDGYDNITEAFSGTDPTRDDYPPEDIQIPDDITVNATGLLTSVDLGRASAHDRKDGFITPAPDNAGPFSPGRHIIHWTATDTAGNRATATEPQILNVLPRANFSVDQTGIKNSTVTVAVQLNGYAPDYPVTIPFTLDGPGHINELKSATLIISEPNSETEAKSDGITATTTITLTNAGEGQTIKLNMGAPTGAVKGNKPHHTITVTEKNIPPHVSLNISQGDGPATFIVVANDDRVVVTATVTDPDPADTHSFSWHSNTLTNTNSNSDANTFLFDTNNLLPGRYRLTVTVSDAAGAQTMRSILFRIVTSPPTLDDKDSDGDGISDIAEGYNDSDSDGIPDYLDAISLKHVVALQHADQARYLVETEPGLSLRLGSIAFAAENHGLAVSATTIEKFATIRSPIDDHPSVGGLFDFEIHGLSNPGDTAKIVLPLRSAIPTNPTYRKMMTTGWQDFIIADNNLLFSAPGRYGSCPPPGNSTYTIGLARGHKCLQLMLEDGGPNDADGVANGVIIDPGGVAAIPVAVVSPPPPDNELELEEIGSGALHLFSLLLLAFLGGISTGVYK